MTCPYEKMTLVGLSFGGWLAAEIAAPCIARVERLVLVDALGIKVSDRETPDILDVFNTASRRRAAAELARSRTVGARLRRDDGRGVRRAARATGTRSASTAGIPYMYNPQLRRWLGAHQRADAGAVGRERRRS